MITTTNICNAALLLLLTGELYEGEKNLEGDKLEAKKIELLQLVNRLARRYGTNIDKLSQFELAVLSAIRSPASRGLVNAELAFNLQELSSVYGLTPVELFDLIVKVCRCVQPIAVTDITFAERIQPYWAERVRESLCVSF